jgi:predicted nucleic acid-binding protein
MDKTINIVFDSCSLINLINGNQLGAVLKLPGFSFYVGPAVYNEVSKKQSQKEIIDKAIEDQSIFLWKKEINLEFVGRLFLTYNLGDGETESIAMCHEDMLYICCDDRQARSAAAKELTESMVMGSLRLLKMTVEQDIIKCTEAKFCYLEMMLKGGFLPKKIEDNYFCKAA